MGPSLELRIEKLVNGGDGLARAAAPGGAPGYEDRRQVIFVPFTLPGELVRVELNLAGGKRATARPLEVLEPAPDRIAPGCEYFGRCGGCQLQHAAPERQIALKREILLETLERLGGIAWAGPVGLHAAAPWGYRNRIRVRRAPQGGVGYYERESHRVLPVTHCPIAAPALERSLAALAAAPPGEYGDGGDDGEIDLATGNDGEAEPSSAPLELQVGAHRYRVSPGSFFQVNRFLAAELVEAVVGGVQGGAALDLFTGVGLFALPLAERFARVEAVESHPAAFADLQSNVARRRNLSVSSLAALAYLRRRAHGPLDLLVADPPRAGLGAALVAAILAQAPQRIHLVSCDPATLGRDLRGLLAGGYQIAELHLFDLFPQTHHIETVVKLAR